MQNPGESITDYLKRRLKEVGASRFDALAARATERAALPEDRKVTSSFIRKFVYGSRENPRVQTIQPLLDYFEAVDAGTERIDDLRHEAANDEQPARAAG